MQPGEWNWMRGLGALGNSMGNIAGGPDLAGVDPQTAGMLRNQAHRALAVCGN